jgi:hypothetical protein
LSRGIYRVTAIAVVTVAAGVTAGSAPAVGQQAISLQLGYTCPFPSGSQPVSAQVTATFPAAGTAGQPIKPAGTRIAVTLPPAAVADLTRLNAASVTLTAGLTTQLTEGTRAGTAIWQHFTSPAAAIPRGGPLTLTASGTAPPITTPAAGTLTVTAAGLSLLFTVRPAANPSANSPPRASPSASLPASRSSMQVTCTLRAGQNTTLARIAVAGPAPARAPAVATSNPLANCLPFPKGLKLNPSFPLPKPPKHGVHVFHQPQRACAYAAGFTNASKLHEAALVGPGLTDLHLAQTVYIKQSHGLTYVQIREPGQLQYQGRPELPPARATFLAFGFEPVSATVQISEIGSLNVSLITCSYAKKICGVTPKNVALFYGLVSLRISNVDVNGVPLNVGPHCQTATPFTLALRGVQPSYNISAQHGVLTGMVTIPPFKGCGVAENLDPVFNATVSGPGNFVKVTQAVLCVPVTHTVCPPRKPIPKH